MISLLVADDEPIVRTFIRRYAQEHGLPVSPMYEASNGQEAIDLALQHKPDLILLDIRMPGVNGLEAAAAIREEVSDACIVMITAYDDFEYVRSALRAGVSDYLLKPLDPKALTTLVYSVLRTKTERARHAAADESKSSHPLVGLVRRHVDAHLHENLRLEGIAKAIHVSPSHCSRTFSTHAGMSISTFITQRRLAKAVRLLENTYTSVTDIAGELGFSSSTYFASWFKRATGLSPLQFRKKQQQKTAEHPTKDA